MTDQDSGSESWSAPAPAMMAGSWRGTTWRAHVGRRAACLRRGQRQRPAGRHLEKGHSLYARPAAARLFGGRPRRRAGSQPRPVPRPRGSATPSRKSRPRRGPRCSPCRASWRDPSSHVVRTFGTRSSGKRAHHEDWLTAGSGAVLLWAYVRLLSSEHFGFARTTAFFCSQG